MYRETISWRTPNWEKRTGLPTRTGWVLILRDGETVVLGWWQGIKFYTNSFAMTDYTDVSVERWCYMPCGRPVFER